MSNTKKFTIHDVWNLDNMKDIAVRRQDYVLAKKLRDLRDEIRQLVGDDELKEIIEKPETE